MAKDREFNVRLTNTERVRAVKGYIKPSGDDLAREIRSRLRQEVPYQSGDLRDSIEITIGEQTTFTYRVSLTIGNEEVKYALAIWKGLDPEIYSVAPNSQPAMIFDADKWPQYDGRFGPVNIFKFDRALKNYIPENDFVGRAMLNIEGIAKNIFRKNINIVFAPGK